SVRIAQEIVDRVVGRGHPDLAEEWEPHAEDRPQRAHPCADRKRVLLERLRVPLEPNGGRLHDAAHGRIRSPAPLSPPRTGARKIRTGPVSAGRRPPDKATDRRNEQVSPVRGWHSPTAAGSTRPRRP